MSYDKESKNGILKLSTPIVSFAMALIGIGT